MNSAQNKDLRTSKNECLPPERLTIQLPEKQ